MSLVIEIDPRVDFACKLIVGNPLFPELTIHFLNAVLQHPVPIKFAQILNPINAKEFESDKYSILDIRAIDELGRIFNIEIQRTKADGLSKRITYYAASNFVDQLGEGEGCESLRPSIAICILTVKLFPDRQAFHNAFRLRSEDNFEFTDSLEIHTIELPKYVATSDNEVLSDPLEEWVHFFLQAKGSTSEELKRRLTSPVFDTAIGVLEMIQRTPDQRRQYEDRIRLERDEQARLKAASDEGKAQGEAIGEAKAKASTIRMLQGLLELDEMPTEKLVSFSLLQLDALIADLQQQLRSRIS